MSVYDLYRLCLRCFRTQRIHRYQEVYDAISGPEYLMLSERYTNRASFPDSRSCSSAAWFPLLRLAFFLRTICSCLDLMMSFMLPTETRALST